MTPDLANDAALDTAAQTSESAPMKRRRSTSIPTAAPDKAPGTLAINSLETVVSVLEPPSEPDLQDEWPPLPPELFINRELSWLEFNRRVLEEAEDRAQPLLERIKFAAIFASNLDEFFMIRVAGVKRKLSAGRTDPGPDGRTPEEAAAAIQAKTQELLDRHASLIKNELFPSLATERIEIVDWGKLKPAEKKALGARFEQDIFPVLTPQAVDSARRFPHVSNQSLNLLVVLRSPASGFRFARVKVPAVFSRLLRVPPVEGEGAGSKAVRFVWIEQVIAANLSRLFPGNEVLESYPFHVIRDSDIDLDEDEDDILDLMVTMKEFLQQRSFGQVVQVVTDRAMPDDVRAWLVEQLHAGERDSYVIDGPLGAENLMELMSIDRPDLKDRPYVPRHTSFADLLGLDPNDPDMADFDIFSALRERDLIVHHPYQSFSIVAEFLRRASLDRDVVAIKQTLYRIGKDSPLVPSLIEARDDDTQVAVLVELKARFDEENNISLAERLENSGVHVAYGVHGLKTHCKATLVVRREREGTRRYVHLSTGNYNATTARIYEDLGLFTAREDIGNDVSELFNVLTGFSTQSEYRKLLVAPVNLREQLLTRIRREIDAHKKHGNGRLIFKMNSIVDRATIRALYAASQAGVQIDLIIRGICCLRPGVPGWSENIRVTSIVGRFLEHSRIYYFGHGGAESLYLGSADAMERNLDTRVEAVFPIEDEAIKRHILDDLLPAYLRDTVNARALHEDGSWTPKRPAKGEEPFDIHAWMMTVYK
jgi:polyphosphate kinase